MIFSLTLEDLDPDGIDGFLPFSGHRYKFSRDALAKDAAEAACAALRPFGRLVEINTVEEMKFVQSILYQQMRAEGSTDFDLKWYIGEFFLQSTSIEIPHASNGLHDINWTSNGP